MFDFIKELGKIDIDYSPDDSEEKKHTFKSYVKSVEDDYLLIDFLFLEGKEQYIPVGKNIKVRFKTGTGIHTGICEMLGTDNKSTIPGIKISFPKYIKFIQQREYIRVPLKLKTEFVIFFDKNGENIISFETETVDISGSGLSFITDKPMEKHSKAIGFITLPGFQEPPIEVILKHVYSGEFFAAGKKRFKNAFTFLEIDDDLREKLLRDIFLFQLEMKKNKILE